MTWLESSWGEFVADQSDAILDAMVTQIQALGLTGVDNARVVKRLLPKVTDELDVLPTVIVCSDPNRADARKRLSFREQQVTYSLLCVIIDANNDDYATKRTTYTGWRDAIVTLLETRRSLGVVAIWDERVEPEVFLNPALLNANYAYLAVGFRPTTIEPRGS